MIELILNLIYPPACGICGKINKNYICSKCRRKINEFQKSQIYKCKSKLIKYHGYLFEYKEIIRNKIIDYKFNEKAYLYKTFSKMILKNENICRFIKKYDIIIPVPIHKKRKNIRGYDQTELIVMEIARTLQINVKNNILIKKNNIKPQSTLSKARRKENIIGAYKLQNYEELSNKKILLIDDIYTTGATIDECAKLFKNIGVKEVSAFTLAKD